MSKLMRGVRLQAAHVKVGTKLDNHWHCSLSKPGFLYRLLSGKYLPVCLTAHRSSAWSVRTKKPVREEHHDVGHGRISYKPKTEDPFVLHLAPHLKSVGNSIVHLKLPILRWRQSQDAAGIKLQHGQH